MMLLHRTLHRSPGRVLRCAQAKLRAGHSSNGAPGGRQILVSRNSFFNGAMPLCLEVAPPRLGFDRGPAEKLSDTQVAALKILCANEGLLLFHSPTRHQINGYVRKHFLFVFTCMRHFKYPRKKILIFESECPIIISNRRRAPRIQGGASQHRSG